MIDESTTFAKKAFGGGFGGMMSGWFGGETKEDDEMLNESNIILGNPLSLWGLQKMNEF